MTFKEYLQTYSISQVMANYANGFNFEVTPEIRVITFYLTSYWAPQYNNFVLNMPEMDFFHKFNNMIINNMPIMINGIKQHKFLVGESILNEIAQLNISAETDSTTSFSNVGYNVEGNYQKQGTINLSKSVDLLGFMERFNLIFMTLTERMTNEIMNYFQVLYNV